MPKKVSKGKKEDKKQDFESFMASLRKNDAFLDLTGHEEKFFKFGDYNLDRALGGGLPDKSIYAFQGPSGCGKTLAALTVAREVINQGKRVLYFDVENKLSSLAQKKFGIFEIPEFQVFSVSTQEDAITSLMEIIDTGFFGLIVIDSVDGLASDEQLERGVHEGSKVGGYQAKTWSEWLRVIPELAARNDCSVLLLRQVRDNPGALYGPTETTSGGRAIEFYATTVLRFGPDKEGNKEEDGRLVYQGAKVKVMKMNQGALPTNPVPIRFHIGMKGPWGVDPVNSTLDEARRLGILAPATPKGTKWIPCPELLALLGASNPDEYSFLGKPAAKDALANDPELLEAVQELIDRCEGEPIVPAVEEVEEDIMIDFEELD